MKMRANHKFMNCPYCSIHNLRGMVGLKAHIRYSHKEKLETPSRGKGLIFFAQILKRAEEYERKAGELRKAEEILIVESLIE